MPSSPSEPSPKVAFLRDRLAEECDAVKRQVDITARHLVLLETMRRAVEEAQFTLAEDEPEGEAYWLASSMLGAIVVAWQEHPDFQPGWMSD